MSESLVMPGSSLESQKVELQGVEMQGVELADPALSGSDRPKPHSPEQPSTTKTSPATERLSTEFSPSSHLRLSASIRFHPDHIVVSQRGQELAFQCDGAIAPMLQQLFLMLDGRQTLVSVQAKFPEPLWGTIAKTLQMLNAQGLLDDVTPVRLEPADELKGDESKGDESKGEVPDAVELVLQHMSQQLDSVLQRNDLWRSLTAAPPKPKLEDAAPSSLDSQVLYGLLLELHYYLDQASAFQSPLRDCQLAATLRYRFSCICDAGREQQAALANALASIGLDKRAVNQHLPLPETVALVNGLAFWSQSQPQFALLLQVTLNQAFTQLVGAFQSACGMADVEMSVVKGVGQVTAIALGLELPLTQFRAACVDEIKLTPEEQARYLGQGYLFAELYDHWLAAIQRDYHEAPQLRRSVLDLAGDGISVERPRLREGVLLRFCDAGLEVRGHGQGIAIALTPEEQPEMQQLLRCLQAGGFSPAELAQAAPGLADQVGELLEAFQAQGWLRTEAEQRPLSGKQFYRELEHFLARIKQPLPPSPMLERMINGKITREQLIGYSLESYHVTYLCPRLLAPALGKLENRATQSLLHDFFTSELHHDQLVENSLKAVDFSLEQIRTMQPLPMTFAVCSSLGVFAQRHPLTFKSALMLFEEDDKTFHQLFEQRCQDLDLPSGFYRPILLHAHINEDGEHDQITKMLLEEVPYISVEEQQLVKKNLAVLLMSMVLRTHEILDYYGDSTHAIPRCF